MRVLAFCSDYLGPFQLTVLQPHRALQRFGVETDFVCNMPSDDNTPGTSVNALVKQISRYDLVIVQRVTSLGLMKMVRNACDLLGKPLINILDDDYLHLEPHNPCYFSTSLGGTVQEWRDLTAEGRVAEAQALVPLLEQQRLQGQDELKAAWALPDCTIVTTNELADVIRPYNRNVHVFNNQMEQVFWETDHIIEEADASGNLKPVMNHFGLGTVPSFYPSYNEKGEITKANRIVRIGYTGTSSHMADFGTIEREWDKLAEKYAEKVWFVYIGDPWFADRQLHGRRRRHWIPNAEYNIYRMNLRNIDVGISPLESTGFNMSKSELKLLELASHGRVACAPNFCTYARAFKHGETALLYNNAKEFHTYMEELINNDRLRIKLGNNAREMVANGRLEKHHSERRFNLYKALVENSVGLTQYTPVGTSSGI